MIIASPFVLSGTTAFPGAVALLPVMGAAQWDGKLGPGYPGAAVLAGQVTNVRAKPVLPPLNDLRADVSGYWQQGCLIGGTNPPKECVYGDTTDPKLTVALVGDSVITSDLPNTGSTTHPKAGSQSYADIGAGIAKYGASSAKCDVQAAKAIDQARCRAVIGNVLVYLDGHHLTASYSKTLAACLKPRLLASGPAFGIAPRDGNRAAAPPGKEIK